MALGKRRKHRQQEFWIAAKDLPPTPDHPFYDRLNALFREHQLDHKLEKAAAPYYGKRNSRPGLPPGVYFRMVLLGYFEGFESDRQIAWEVERSKVFPGFLGYSLIERTPDHSTLSKARKRLPKEWHDEAFALVLAILAEHGLIKGDTIGIDASTMDANAALRSLRRKVDGKSYEEYVQQLAAESGVEVPTAEALARFDRKRKCKKMSNDDWENPHDPDAKIGKTKDGRTRMIHKPEHAVDLDNGAILAADVHPADEGDTTTGPETLDQASENLDRAMTDVPSLECGGVEVVADKGYHSDRVLTGLQADGYRSYIAEPDRGRRRWTDREGHKSEVKADAQYAVYGNRRRVKGNRGKALMRRRGELIERSFAHMLDTGGMRRTTLRGRENINKRYSLQAAAFNLSLVMRRFFGHGKPRAFAASLSKAALQALSWLFAPLLSWLLHHLGHWSPPDRLGKPTTHRQRLSRAFADRYFPTIPRFAQALR